MKNIYNSPLSSRYASKEMNHIFSEDNKFVLWRKLWIALAESEKELGLNISDIQIEEMKKNLNNINYTDAEKKEKEIRHDVMSHVYAFGKQCPNAKPIIHLGATSCFVGDNSDIIIINQALNLIKQKVVKVIELLSDFAMKTKDIPTLAYTHFQAAQPTTVGKRATLWIQDLCMDIESINHLLENIKLLGCKGTTGTQASFLELFNGDNEKVKKLDQKIAQKMGFKKCFDVSGQTYSRKFDSNVLSVLSAVAQSAAKFSNDIRLLQHLKEIEEPFESSQIGSSAMPYKRNPMRCERMAALCRFIITQSLNAPLTASTQWFERTLDDSANRRLCISESFLALDGVLNTYINVSSGLVVNEKIIEKHLMNEIQFMATENILMEAVKSGGDRQILHEKIREYSMAEAYLIKKEGKENHLLEKILTDKDFKLSENQLDKIKNPKNYVGRASNQTEEYIKEIIMPLIEANKNNIEINENNLVNI
ncbi:MAG: adenylosuccinate lyase [Acutalibacteraceae bacterium]